MYNCTAACLFAWEGSRGEEGGREGGRGERQAESEELDIINLFTQKDRNYLTH